MVIQSTASPQPIEEIRVYPGRDGEFALYDDDGKTYDYEKGKGTTTLLRWNDAAQKLTVTGGDKALARTAPGLVKVAGQ